MNKWVVLFIIIIVVVIGIALYFSWQNAITRTDYTMNEIIGFLTN